MPKMIVSIDGVVIKEVQLTKDRTTLGRRPYNDVVIDNLAISGEHAVFQMAGNDVFIEDLNSTNGTYVNGKAAKKQQLANGDTVEVGKYKIKFVSEAAGDGFEKTMMVRSRLAAWCPAAGPRGPPMRCPADVGAVGLMRGPPRPHRLGSAPGFDQGAVRRRCRAGGAADQGRHHDRQTRGRGGCDHQAPARLRRAPCGRCRQSLAQRCTDRHRSGVAQER
jgi:hypothetical protein